MKKIVISLIWVIIFIFNLSYSEYIPSYVYYKDGYLISIYEIEEPFDSIFCPKSCSVDTDCARWVRVGDNILIQKVKKSIFSSCEVVTKMKYNVNVDIELQDDVLTIYNPNNYDIYLKNFKLDITLPKYVKTDKGVILDNRILFEDLVPANGSVSYTIIEKSNSTIPYLIEKYSFLVVPLEIIKQGLLSLSKLAKGDFTKEDFYNLLVFGIFLYIIFILRNIYSMFKEIILDFYKTIKFVVNLIFRKSKKKR